MLSFRVPVFTKKTKRKVVAHPKFYFFDAGVFRTLRPKGPLDTYRDIESASLEGLVAQHLKAWCSYRGEKNNLYYWRTRAGNGVDFILYGEEVFWAIEVKNKTKIFPEDLRGLISFKEDYPLCETYLVYCGKEKIKKGHILCVPAEEFL
ncbi:MAG: DUF4143 domain-containing protein [Endomicrobiia bacterium]